MPFGNEPYEGVAPKEGRKCINVGEGLGKEEKKGHLLTSPTSFSPLALQFRVSRKKKFHLECHRAFFLSNPTLLPKMFLVS